MCQKKSSSSFVFGLVLGAIIGAIIAIVIYKKSKGKILEDLQNRLTHFFTPLVKSKKKKTKSVIAQTEVPVHKKTPPKVFIRK